MSGRVAARLARVAGRPGVLVELDERSQRVELRLSLSAARDLRDVIEAALEAAEHELAEVGMRQ